ncbi:TVP38/TMEM64 family protein [Clostridium rectalis]|uniref:TVP38/TMEM64 family protein n=1 Tax=Clostridium rectalis TaxID=2040295 RepID=UPI000F6416D8|nr:TVP38/TMEM64 family protein [Clostridium rectalis]
MKKKSIWKIVILISIIIFIVFIVTKHGVDFKNINIKSLTHFVRRSGKYAAVCFLIICGLKPIVLFIPAAMLSIVAGIIFGPVKGFILNMGGFFLAGTLAFYLSRFLGKEFVDRILKGKALKINNNLEKDGFKVLFLLRLPPVLPYDPLSYTCGLTKMKYSDFILASLLGVVPETLCYSLMGKNIINPWSPKFIIPLCFIIIATVSSTYFFKKANS